MRREGLALPAARKVPAAERLERVRIDAVRQPVFLQRIKLAVVHQRRRVADGTQVWPRRVAYRGIVGVGIAVITVELATGRADLLQPLGLDPAAAEVDPSVADPEHADVAVGVERGVV